MKALRDPQCLLSDGLAAIRKQFKVPQQFPAEVERAAADAAQRSPSDHADRTGRPFITLDPAGAVDLDQAFAIEPAGADLLLHYAIADVAWFVSDGDPVDSEAWLRGETTYLPDGKASLYPRVLSEGAASLLPDGPRPAIVFTTRVGPDGAVDLAGVERALIRSRAKLDYETATAADLPAHFDAMAQRLHHAEEARGAARVDPPEQEVSRDALGRMTLQMRPLGPNEQRNAALSLATNLAVAQALLAAGTGLFRVMPGPDPRAEARLRHTARAFGLDWPDAASLAQFERLIDPADPRAAAFMLAIRKAGNGASYAPFSEGETPWHAAVAAPYAHATAPLRRMADRYVIQAAYAVANGKPVPPQVSAAFERLPPVMAKAGARSAQVERAVIDLAEACLLEGREGEQFAAVVTDLGEQGARFQLRDLPVVARTTARRVMPGDEITLTLEEADPQRREVRFARVA